MKDIRFKAWDAKHRRLMEIVSLEFNFIYQGKKCIAVWRKPYKFENSNAISLRAKVNYTALMRYTGIKDKNGTDIYEDDIVKVQYYLDTKKYIYGVVRFKDGRFIVDTEEIETLLSTEKYIEIVGNKYENKELLDDQARSIKHIKRWRF